MGKRKSGWHGGKRTDKVSFEGTQYRGGRQKGKKNLQKVDGGYILKADTKIGRNHDIFISNAERKMLESEVNKANYRRTKMLEAEGNLPRMVGGVDTGDKVASLQLMGKESDFILTRKSKSLQRFRTKEDFDRYLDNLQRVNSPTYIDDRTRLYKRNHMKALEKAFGEDAKDVVMKIRMMKPEEYRRMIQQDEFLEVSYVYDPSAREGKLNMIRQALGMKEKESYIDEV